MAHEGGEGFGENPPRGGEDGQGSDHGKRNSRSLPDEACDLHHQVDGPEGQADREGQGEQQVRRAHHRRDASPPAGHQGGSLLDDRQAESDARARHQDLDPSPERVRQEPHDHIHGQVLASLKRQSGPDEGQPDEEKPCRLLGPVERIVQDVAEEDADENEGRLDGEETAAGDLESDARESRRPRLAERWDRFGRESTGCGGVVAPPQLGIACHQDPRAAFTLS